MSDILTIQNYVCVRYENISAIASREVPPDLSTPVRTLFQKNFLPLLKEEG